MSERPSRDADTRAAEIRAIRPANYNYDLGIIKMPDSMKRDGYALHGARLNVNGVEDGRVEKLVSDGYETIPSSRLANYHNDPLNRDRFQNKNITTNNEIVWLEIPEVIQQEKWEAEQALTREKVGSLRNIKSSDIVVDEFDDFYNS